MTATLACASCAKQETVVSETTAPIFVEEAVYVTGETTEETEQTKEETAIAEEQPYEEIDFTEAEITMASLVSDGLLLELKSKNADDEISDEGEASETEPTEETYTIIGTSLFNKGHIESSDLSLEQITVGQTKSTMSEDALMYNAMYKLSGNALDTVVFSFSEADVEPKEFPEDELTETNELNNGLEQVVGSAVMVDFGKIYQGAKSEGFQKIEFMYNKYIIVTENVGAFDIAVFAYDEIEEKWGLSGFGISGITEGADNIILEITEDSIIVSSTENMKNITCRSAKNESFSVFEMEDTNCIRYSFETNEVEALTQDLTISNIGNE